MRNIEISGSAELTLRIVQLKEEEASLEIELKQSFNEFKQLIYPGSKDNKSALLNLAKMALYKTTNYIIEKKFGQNHSFKGFLFSMVVELLSTSFIRKKIGTIFQKNNN